MAEFSIKRRLAAGETLRVFSLGRVTHPIFVEMFAQAGGYDGFWIDSEHSAPPPDQLLVLALAGRANQFDCFVRMPAIGYWEVTRALETGVSGVMASQIRSVAQAEQFVRWAKFPPVGERGTIMSGRDANYTHKTVAQFVGDANRDTFVAIQIETTAALEAVDEIAGLGGVDSLFIGPTDLSVVLGIPGQFHDERLWTAIGQVAEACRRHGKTWGCVAPDPKFADRAVETGCRLVTIGNEVLVIRRGIEFFKTAFASRFARGVESRGR
jgi:2-dehydro-3-deoxyglucarate aldolase/4-hydroxy-2-oxoheptanedioate aldolase